MDYTQEPRNLHLEPQAWAPPAQKSSRMPGARPSPPPPPGPSARRRAAGPSASGGPRPGGGPPPAAPRAPRPAPAWSRRRPPGPRPGGRTAKASQGCTNQRILESRTRRSSTVKGSCGLEDFLQFHGWRKDATQNQKILWNSWYSW